MNIIEAAKLLTVAGGFDNRRADEINTTAWLAALGQYTYSECEAAVISHFTDTATRHEYLRVGHVLDRLEASNRVRTADVEADVRSAKARGLIAQDHPRKEPLPASVADRLAEARRADAAEATMLGAPVLESR